MIFYAIEFGTYFAEYFFLVSLFILPCALGTLTAYFRRHNKPVFFLHGIAATVSGVVGSGLASLGLDDAFFSPNSLGNFMFLFAAACSLASYIASYGICWLLLRTQLGKVCLRIPARGRQLTLATAACIALLGLGSAGAFVALGADAALARSTQDPRVLAAIYADVGPSRNLEDVYVAASLASNLHLSAETETKLATHPHEAVRWGIANRPDIHKDTRALLTQDCSIRIRQQVLKPTTDGNATTPTPTGSDCGAQYLHIRALR